MKIIVTENAPGAIGPYSQGYETNGLVITSGQLPVDPATGAMPEGIAAQAEWSCKNVGAILEAAGVGFDKVIKTTCFLANMSDFAAFNEVYAKYLYLQARPQLRGGEGPAQGRSVRDRGHG